MTAADWDALVELYVTHADRTLPENARLIHAAQMEAEIDILSGQGRLS